MIYGNEMSKTQNTMFTIGLVFAMGLLFIVMTQPVWNSTKMIADFKAKCDAQHGVQYVHHGMFGDTYECLPLLDKGIQP